MTKQQYLEELRLQQQHAESLDQWEDLAQQIKELEKELAWGG
jgi:hypothetical protein